MRAHWIRSKRPIRNRLGRTRRRITKSFGAHTSTAELLGRKLRHFEGPSSAFVEDQAFLRASPEGRSSTLQLARLEWNCECMKKSTSVASWLLATAKKWAARSRHLHEFRLTWSFEGAN